MKKPTQSFRRSCGSPGYKVPLIIIALITLTIHYQGAVSESGATRELRTGGLYDEFVDLAQDAYQQTASKISIVGEQVEEQFGASFEKMFPDRADSSESNSQRTNRFDVNDNPSGDHQYDVLQRDESVRSDTLVLGSNKVTAAANNDDVEESEDEEGKTEREKYDSEDSQNTSDDGADGPTTKENNDDTEEDNEREDEDDTEKKNEGENDDDDDKEKHAASGSLKENARRADQANRDGDLTTHNNKDSDESSTDNDEEDDSESENENDNAQRTRAFQKKLKVKQAMEKEEAPTEKRPHRVVVVENAAPLPDAEEVHALLNERKAHREDETNHDVDSDEGNTQNTKKHRKKKRKSKAHANSDADTAEQGNAFKDLTQLDDTTANMIEGGGALRVRSKYARGEHYQRQSSYESETVFNYTALGIELHREKLYGKDTCTRLTYERIGRPNALDFVHPMNRKEFEKWGVNPPIESVSAKCFLTQSSKIEKQNIPLNMLDRVCAFKNLCVQGGRRMTQGLDPEEIEKENTVRKFTRPVIFINNNSRNQLSRVLTVVGIYDALDLAGLWPPERRVEIVIMKDEAPQSEREKAHLLPFFDPKMYHISYSGTWMNPKGHATCFDQSVVGAGGSYFPILRTRDNITIAQTSRKYPDSHLRLQHIMPRVISEFTRIHGDVKPKPCTALLIIRGSTRQIKNRDEVVEFLESEGYKVTMHDFSGQDLLEQKLVSREYEVVIGMHGAGLVNIIMSPNTSLIELHPYKHSKETYSALYSYTESPYYAWYNQEEKNSFENNESKAQTNDHYFWKQRHQYIDMPSFNSVTWQRYRSDQDKRTGAKICRP
ncbi:hypothetical protein SARC_03866 [Sphaeroforma arctica JP610]|uniref:Glycosyltransferase 61 catalytic domain-containing protein n=1 Tax=Sphaeroforma arctica JP610 TaxID=667725 RepID=A0A0L0G474_9EUKA|nr:hypothetical protein SARC_03866 [Sphaeroforma arctica JP610]KNC83907.1 hypothetical protein SARC_03866 [Sphaeroforma arctica JP610]|eukprot:XP_014157809.1 hypothetical protein SARC_03866 [Sphaeroforma arctica JP610]